MNSPFKAATRAEKRALRKANWAEALALETEIAAAQSQLDQLQSSVGKILDVVTSSLDSHAPSFLFGFSSAKSNLL